MAASIYLFVLLSHSAPCQPQACVTQQRAGSEDCFMTAARSCSAARGGSRKHAQSEAMRRAPPTHARAGCGSRAAGAHAAQGVASRRASRVCVTRRSWRGWEEGVTGVACRQHSLCIPPRVASTVEAAPPARHST
jgi:hypothetical protein